MLGADGPGVAEPHTASAEGDHKLQLARLVPIAKRWVVEQVNGTLMLHRRLVREYESRPESSVSRTLWASADNLVRRLTGTSTPSWRDPT
jgi:uncharacterized Fe-S cluster-containing radical SAM superfamily protein